MYSSKQIPRVMLIGLSDPFKDKEVMVSDFEEVESLVKTFGGKVVSAIVQNKTRGSSSTFIGKGKVDRAKEAIEAQNIDIVVINEAIKPTQLHNLFLMFHKINPNILVWDRVSLILEIFSKHAKTAEAKLQIRFAKMRQMGPRIYGMGMEMSNQAAGIGARGVGETNTELMLRHWKDEKDKIQKELAMLSARRKDQIDHRKEGGLPTISVAGYTNAGKTTLFNVLTGKDDLAENALFATLDSTVNKFYLKDLNREVYLSDTIGFIKNLPPLLIDAFKSTLLEAINADLVMNVIDGTDLQMKEKIKTVQDIFSDLEIDYKNIMFVFNKMEEKTKDQVQILKSEYSEFNPVFISAKTGDGIEDLLNVISKKLKNFKLVY